MLKSLFFACLVLLALNLACSKTETTSVAGIVVGAAVKVPPVAGCPGCHPLSMDQKHALACDDCHGGDAQANDKQLAHAGLNAQAAHPERMQVVCGKCHAQIVRQAAKTLHFTVADEVNLLRQAFGAKERLASLTDIPERGEPSTRLELVDDLLRRRCLRCHLYSSGDAYPATRHGTGCAACHLAFQNGVLSDHRFLPRPTDLQCLSCHYGNRVGDDYYGRFEQDYNWDYRTPFQAAALETMPPYGVGFHQLSPDLHQQAGMFCIDCHSGRELMAGEGGLSCLSCHQALLDHSAPTAVTETDGRRQLTIVATGKRLEVPVMKDPAHARDGLQVACQVCHGQWSFADHGNHLLRQDTPDYGPWQTLTRQGSAELETKLNLVLSENAEEQELTMADGISGQARPGVWLQAYELRRWEEINTCLDPQGVLQVCRPILDLHLSYVNAEGELVFDGAKPGAGTSVMLPYTPHTTGRAGAFYLERLPRDRRQETEVRRQETEDRSQESEDRRQETGDRSQESGDRSQETGDRRQETEDRSKEGVEF